MSLKARLWFVYVVLCFVGMAVGMIVIVFVVRPLVWWLNFSVSYSDSLPTWGQFMRLALVVPWFGLFGGTICWIMTKHEIGSGLGRDKNLR